MHTYENKKKIVSIKGKFCNNKTKKKKNRKKSLRALDIMYNTIFILIYIHINKRLRFKYLKLYFAESASFFFLSNTYQTLDVHMMHAPSKQENRIFFQTLHRQIKINKYKKKIPRTSKRKQKLFSSNQD